MQFKLSNLNLSTVKVQFLRDASFPKYDFKINNAADVDHLFGAELRKLDREHLLAIYLNSRRKIIDIEVVAIGTLSEMIISPREVFKSAILANAHALILVHNHPSGDETPGIDDMKMTQEMKAAGKLLKIPIWDHVIIGNGWFSFFESIYK